jgi:hypothetical protein
LLVLHALRCIGFASLAGVAEATGLPEPDVESELIDLAVAGLVTHVPGDFGGWGLTEAGRGGPASHAAVVARAMGKPAVVGATDLTVDVADAAVRAGGHTVPEGTLITIDGTGGAVVIGSPRIVRAANDPHLCRLLEWADEVSGGSSDRNEAGRLSAAHAVLPHG